MIETIVFVIGLTIGFLIGRQSAIMREKLAKLAHEQWAGWAVERWRRQMEPPFSELSESEQDSDRKEADKFLAIIRPEHAEMDSRDTDNLSLLNVLRIEEEAIRLINLQMRMDNE